MYCARAFLVGASAIGLLISAATAGQGCEAPADGAGASFPLQVQPGERLLEDADGRPFFLHGDTAWSLIGSLSREDADLYLQDRQSRGFNTILVNLIEHRFAQHAPANAYGDRPFQSAGDYATPNERYFEHADWVLRRACELGLLVMLTPSYVGYQGGQDGWYQTMLENGAVGMLDYGRFVGRRYGHLDNIVWVHGGDYDPPDKDLIRALIDGINETDPNALHTAHGAPETVVEDYWSGEPWLSITNVYTYGPVHEPAGEQSRRDGTRPSFLIESAYENEHGADEQRVRMQAYQAVLSGLSGHIYGNNPIWHFDGPGLHPTSTTWQEELDSPGARSMSVLKELMSSQDWWLLEPDLDGSFLVGGAGRAGSRAVAAMAADGSYALVYVPSSRRIALDLGRMGGNQVAAQWFDPSTGQVAPSEGSPFAPGIRFFGPKRENGSGFRDWVLILSSPSRLVQSQ